jgi:hypothetical protein
VVEGHYYRYSQGNLIRLEENEDYKGVWLTRTPPPAPETSDEKAEPITRRKSADGLHRFSKRTMTIKRIWRRLVNRSEQEEWPVELLRAHKVLSYEAFYNDLYYFTKKQGTLSVAQPRTKETLVVDSWSLNPNKGPQTKPLIPLSKDEFVERMNELRTKHELE